MIAVMFWVALLLLVYIYFGYPLLLAALTRAGFGRGVRQAPAEPSVTLVISAFNEAAVIRRKIENSLALDYPSERLQVIVVSDASDDGTDEIVRDFDGQVELLRMEERGGKTLGLNAAVAQARGEIVVFSDANAMYEPDVIRNIGRNFADPAVGAVTGESRYVVGDEDLSTQSENAYWSYELGLKAMESRLGSLVGGDGAIYAIRRELYRPMAASDLSDFINPLQIVAQGYRNVYEPQAVSWEGGAEGFQAEYRRKVRIVNRAWRATAKMRALLNPFRYGWFAVQFLSHKLLRWLAPVFMGLVLLTSILLVVTADGWFYGLALAGQLAFYGLALAGQFLARTGRAVPALLRIPYYFCLVNLASLMALLQLMVGKRYTTWNVSRAEAQGSVRNSRA